MSGNGLFVEYCAKDFLDGTQTLDPWEELAYRRIIDLIYTPDDNVPDDDKKLAWQTKTGNRWPRIKASLTTGDKPKLMIVEGRITNLRCQKTLEKSARNIGQKRKAGQASAEARKPLKDNETIPAAVDAAVPTAVPTAVSTNQEPKKERKKVSKEEGVESHTLEPSPSRARERASARDADPVVQASFERFWEAYPRRDGKIEALKAFRTALGRAGPDEIVEGARLYAAKVARDGTETRFVKTPGPWLNGGKWADESLRVERMPIVNGSGSCCHDPPGTALVPADAGGGRPSKPGVLQVAAGLFSDTPEAKSKRASYRL